MVDAAHHQAVLAAFAEVQSGVCGECVDALTSSSSGGCARGGARAASRPGEPLDSAKGRVGAPLGVTR